MKVNVNQAWNQREAVEFACNSRPIRFIALALDDLCD
jgi:hypothetical protein